MIELPSIIDTTGVRRILACLPPNVARQVALRASLEAVPDIPKSEWRPINRRSALPIITDQRSHGSCVGYSSAAALSRARALNGQPYVILSGAMVYSEINGGRDQGAIIHDAIGVLQKGVCTEQEAPWDAIYPNRIPAAAYKTRERFKATNIYTIRSYSQFISAIQLNFIPVFAVMVGNTFQRMDSYGILGFDSGPGNHAVHADGCQLVNGQWVADMVNSWGNAFGQNGRGYITQRHFENIGYQDAYAIQSVTEDTGDDSVPPAVKED